MLSVYNIWFFSYMEPELALYNIQKKKLQTGSLIKWLRWKQNGKIRSVFLSVTSDKCKLCNYGLGVKYFAPIKCFSDLSSSDKFISHPEHS